MLTFAVSQQSGLVGGPIFLSLFTDIGWGHIAALIFASSGLICTPVAPATISAPPPTAKYPHQGDS